MHIAEVVTIAKSLPLLRLNTYKSLILSYSADYRRIFRKKILVIGANGFVGRRILDNLSENGACEVFGCSLHPDIRPGGNHTSVRLDINDYPAVEPCSTISVLMSLSIVRLFPSRIIASSTVRRRMPLTCRR